MLWQKKILKNSFCSLLILSVLFLSSCCNKNTVISEQSVDFPLDDKGYPQNNVVIINEKPYSIDLTGKSHTASKVDSEIEAHIAKESDVVEITLPQYLPINSWSIEEKYCINLISYSKIECPVKDENMLEGVSPVVQKYKIQVIKGEKTEIFFKWANIYEADNPFKDKNEDYLLKIIVTS